MKLVEYLPDFMQDIKEFKELFDIEDIEIEKLKVTLEKILNEVIVKTAIGYGLERYERIYNIKQISNNIEERRFAILSKKGNKVPYTYQWLIGKLTSLFGKDNYELTADFENYKLHIKTYINELNKIDIMLKTLENILPANIEITTSNEEKAIITGDTILISIITNYEIINITN